MASEAKVGVTRDQHLFVDGPMRVMTNGASFAHRLMLEHKRSPLRDVAAATGFMFGGQGCASAADSRSFVRIVTIAATDLAVADRVAVGQLKLPLLIQVTLETGVGGFLWIDDGMMSPAGLIVNASGAVARFAADLLRILPLGLQTRVGRGLKITNDGVMTLLTTF